jgi:uncharacterized membrane protein YfcA
VIAGFLVLLCATALVAYGVRGATGAASAIVANAMLAVFVIPASGGGELLREGLYWVAFADCFAAVVMVVVLRSTIELEPIVVRFLAFSLPVNIVFTLVLRSMAAPVLGILLGCVLVGAGAYLAVRPAPREWSGRALRTWAGPSGIAAGALGGLFGMAGPIAMLFFSRAGGDPSAFRRRVTVLSFVSSQVRLLVLVLSGAVGAITFETFVFTIPWILIGLAIGLRVHRHISPRPFWRGLGLIVELAGLGAIVRVLLAG